MEETGAAVAEPTAGAREKPPLRRLDGVLHGLFALVGVVIGGIVTFEVTWWQNRETRIADDRQATRLVAQEIRADTTKLLFAYEYGHFGQNGPTSTKYWESEAPILARNVSSDVWNAASAFYIQLQTVAPSLSQNRCVAPGTAVRTYAKQGGNLGNQALTSLGQKPITVPASANPCK
jgi:hypothetical protein